MTFTPDKIIKVLGGDLRPWAHRCHEASLRVVREAGLGPMARVARGRHDMVRGQHSWVVLGNPYDTSSLIVDPTLWCNLHQQPFVFIGDGGHSYVPKGSGHIFDYGMPPDPVGPVITLQTKLSEHARTFLKIAAPNGLDERGWMFFANAPVKGWPSKEIIEAIADDHRLRAFVPIDVLGMLTDRNPGGLYR